MRALSRYSPILIVLGIAAALLAGVLRLLEGEFNSRVQISVAVALVLFAAYMALEAEGIQKWAGGRQARYGANAVLMSVAFIAIVVILNYLSNSRYHTDWDLTENQVNTLADQTTTVLADLPEPVKVTAFISSQSDSYRTSSQRLLQSYADKSNGKLTYEIIDPFVRPSAAAQMGVTRDSTVVFAMGEQREEIQFGGEQEFTSALIRLAHPEQRVVYFVTGHGEHDVAETQDTGYSKVKRGLERQNYTVQTLNLVVTDTIPSDASAVIVAGPQVTFTSDETLALGNYLDAGGAVIFLLDPRVQMREGQPEEDPLATWLSAAWGVTVNDDLVIDPASSQAGDPFVPFAFGYGNSPITEKLLSQNLTSQYPLARSVSLPTDPTLAAEITITPLVFTSEQAWGETDMDSLQTGVAYDPAADVAGPLNVGVTVENSATQARMVVFGDSDFASNVVADAYANLDILVNSVNWVTGNADLISIPPRASNTRPPLDLSTRTIATLGLISACVMPFGVLLAGVAVVWNRRNRYK